MFVDTLAEDLSFDRAIDTYIRVMGIPEPLASAVATRALVTLGRDLVRSADVRATRAKKTWIPSRSVRLDDAAARQRKIRRA